MSGHVRMLEQEIAEVHPVGGRWARRELTGRGQFSCSCGVDTGMVELGEARAAQAAHDGEVSGRCPNCGSGEKPVRGARPMMFSTVEPVDFMGDKVTVRVSQEICDHDWHEGQFAGVREVGTP